MRLLVIAIIAVAFFFPHFSVDDVKVSSHQAQLQSDNVAGVNFAGSNSEQRQATQRQEYFHASFFLVSQNEDIQVPAFNIEREVVVDFHYNLRIALLLVNNPHCGPPATLS